MKKRFLKNDINYFERLSQIKSATQLVQFIVDNKFKIVSFGASAFVFTKLNLDYVIKFGDSIDMIPRKSSKFYKLYAKVIYRSKNKKLIVQEKVSMSIINTNKAIKLISEKYKISLSLLDEDYDIRTHNVGMRNNKPKIIDYRNYSSKQRFCFSDSPHWYGENLEKVLDKIKKK